MVVVVEVESELAEEIVAPFDGDFVRTEEVRAEGGEGVAYEVAGGAGFEVARAEGGEVSG